VFLGCPSPYCNLATSPSLFSPTALIGSAFPSCDGVCANRQVVLRRQVPDCMDASTLPADSFGQGSCQGTSLP